MDYRLAPEYKFPTPFEDCLTATLWAMANAESLGGRPDAIAVGGDSAGGNLAAAVSLAQDDFPNPLAFQLLVYPVTDYAYETRSYQVNGQGMFLETASMRWFWDHYVDLRCARGLSNDLPPAQHLREVARCARGCPRLLRTHADKGRQAWIAADARSCWDEGAYAAALGRKITAWPAVKFPTPRT